MANKMVFKKWKFACKDAHRWTDFRWDYEAAPPCPECGTSDTYFDYGKTNRSTGVISDEIDVMINHGLCYPDGTPRRFTSMTELRREAQKAGLTISGETPNLTSQQKEEKQREQEAWNKKWS